jgi:hypothetical protein
MAELRLPQNPDCKEFFVFKILKTWDLLEAGMHFVLCMALAI